MPVKNASLYISDALNSLRSIKDKEWELIAIDDHSTDESLAILEEAQKENCRIKVAKNNGHGKVLALNHGYSLTRGDIIKCIDADDVLATTFLEILEEIADSDASCHDYYITNSNLKIFAKYSMNKAFFNESFEHCMRYLISLPRCVWSFKRHIGDMIFPMPDNLPFEDVWFSLIIKKYAGTNIHHISQPLYYSSVVQRLT